MLPECHHEQPNSPTCRETDTLRQWAVSSEPDETAVRPSPAERHPGHRPGAATVVRLEGVSRRYQVGESEVYALRDVDLEVDEGEFVVVLGPSGSGKSTLLNIISALDTPNMSDSAALVSMPITTRRRGPMRSPSTP